MGRALRIPAATLEATVRRSRSAQVGGTIIRARNRRALIGALVTICLLSFAGAAYSASSEALTGKTSQGEPISFSISGGYLRRLNFLIQVKCPSRQAYRVHDYAFPAIPVVHSKVNEKFVSSSPKATATIKGSVQSEDVTGTLSDTTFIKQEHRTCHGSATFSLH